MIYENCVAFFSVKTLLFVDYLLILGQKWEICVKNEEKMRTLLKQIGNLKKKLECQKYFHCLHCQKLAMNA